MLFRLPSNACSFYSCFWLLTLNGAAHALCSPVPRLHLASWRLSSPRLPSAVAGTTHEVWRSPTSRDYASSSRSLFIRQSSSEVKELLQLMDVLDILVHIRSFFSIRVRAVVFSIILSVLGRKRVLEFLRSLRGLSLMLPIPWVSPSAASCRPPLILVALLFLLLLVGLLWSFRDTLGGLFSIVSAHHWWGPVIVLSHTHAHLGYWFVDNSSVTLSCSFYLFHCSRCPNRTHLLEANLRETTQVATSLICEARKKGDEELGMS